MDDVEGGKRCIPESVRDRCTKSHEYIFLLSKSDRCYFNGAAIREPVAESTVTRMKQDSLPCSRKSWWSLAFDPRYSKWNYADLPIVPHPWQYRVLPDTKKQLTHSYKPVYPREMQVYLLNLDCYYGNETDQCGFYRIPKTLLIDARSTN